MSKTRGALLLLASIGVLLAILLLAVPRRPARGAGRRGRITSRKANRTPMEARRSRAKRVLDMGPF